MADKRDACLVAGLGNPGKDYQSTRHNVGFLVVDQLVSRWGLGPLSGQKKFDGEVGVTNRSGRRVVLLKPLSYMNLSGGPVQKVAHYYQVEPAGLVVVCDDVNIPFGTLRIREKGGPGGHNGLKSIEQQLGTHEYVRMRVGVGGGTPGRDLTGHVLGRFSQEEAKALPQVLERCALAVEVILERGVAVAMSQFNGSALEAS